MDIQSLLEAKQVGSAMLVTGALNPYTSAHEAVAEMAMRHAMDTGHTHFYHGIGASEMKPDAPLTHEQKTKIVAGSHKHITKKLGSTLQTEVIPRASSVSPFHQIAYLISKGHKNITVAVGSDQLEQGGLRTHIEKHMKQHGGFLGIDNKPHQVEIKFQQIGEPRHEGEITRPAILSQIKKGDIRSVKAGRLRSAVAAGDTELAHAMMPPSIRNKQGYFNLIASQQKKVEQAKAVKKKKKKKITECFSMDKINEFMNILTEAQIVRGAIEERKAKRQKIVSDMKRKHAENMLALILQQQAQRKSVGSSPELRDEQKAVRDQTRMGFMSGLKNRLMSHGLDFARKIMKAKVKEVQLGLDKPPRTEGAPQQPRRGTMHEEVLNEGRRKSVSSPSKMRKKVRTEIRSSARGGDRKTKDKIRKQEDRREEKKSSGYAVIMRKEGSRNKIKIVKKEDIGSSKIIVKPEEFTKAKARQYLKEPDFEITDSSKRLFPEFSRQKGKGKAKGKKAEETSGKKEKKQKKQSAEEAKENLPQLPETPKGGRERTTPKSQYPDFNHTSLELEAAIPVMLNQMMGVAVDPTLMEKVGPKIKTSQTLGASAQRAAQAIVDQFGEVVSVHMGAAKTTITPLWKQAGGTDTTPKTDILLVPKKLWIQAKGDVSKIDMRKAIRCSMKVGDARVINAESGEAAATVEAAMQMAGDIASKNKRVKGIIKAIKDAMLGFAKSAELGQFTVDDVRDMVAAEQEPDDPNFKKYVRLINQQDKLKDFVADKFREVFDISKEFRSALLRESFTGVAKFGQNSAACATHVLAMTKDGSNLAIEEISDEFLDKILPDLKIRGAFKGRSWEVGPKGKKTKLRGFSTLFNIDYKRRIHEEKEQGIQQSVETLEPSPSMTYPGAVQIVKDELDQIGDNFDLLMEYSDLEPSMITSNALDLTDYVNVPARAYNTITIDNNRVVTIPVHDFERYEQQQQEIEMMNEDPYHFINDFLAENANNQEGIELAFTSGLVSPETITKNIDNANLSEILNEMWENSMINPQLFETFIQEAKARNYKKEYREYHGKAEQRANRSKRVLARRKMMKKGKVRKGDGKDVHHEDGNPQNNGDSNLKVLSKSKNRAMHEEHGAGEVGTDALRKKFIKDTPNAVDPINLIKGVVKNGVKHK
jgi:hypothetical protein